MGSPCALGDHNDLKVYNPVTNEWSNLQESRTSATPTTRDSFGFTSADGKLYLFGGENADFVPGMLTTQPTVWVSISRELRPYLAVYYNDLHSFDLSSVEWVALDPGSEDAEADMAQDRPSPRTYLGLAATSTHLYLFGGWGGTGEPVFRPPLRSLKVTARWRVSF